MSRNWYHRGGGGGCDTAERAKISGKREEDRMLRYQTPSFTNT